VSSVSRHGRCCTFRGLTLKGGDKGFSPISSPRHALEASRLRYDHEQAFFRNHAEVPGVLEGPDINTREKALETARIWAATHGGPYQSGKIAVVGNGATYRQLGLTMKDAEFIDSHRFAVEDIGRMFSIPSSLLGAGDIGLRLSRTRNGS
jgi:phage portal protein BeeE